MNEREHPSKDIIGSVSRELLGKKIVLGVTGSVAAVKSVEIARELMRHGAEVYPVMTKAACDLINPALLHWATGHETITELTGKIEHVALCGNVRDKADLLLIAPATANTVGKIAAAIDDTTVTTFATTALGEGIPLILVPAMHESMYRHPLVKGNVSKLEALGVKILLPDLQEGKAKIPDTAAIVHTVKNCLLKDLPLRGKKILINTGRTIEYIDPIRVITNNSTGKMGMALARQAQLAGGEVSIVYGKGTAQIPADCRVLQVETSEEMHRAVLTELKKESYDIVILSAAIADFKPRHKAGEKISTHTTKQLALELVPTPKILDEVKASAPQALVVAFRALYNLAPDALIEDAYQRLLKAQADLIAVNDVSQAGRGFEAETNELYVINKTRQVRKIGFASKDAVAKELLDIILQELSSKHS